MQVSSGSLRLMRPSEVQASVLQASSIIHEITPAPAPAPKSRPSVLSAGRPSFFMRMRLTFTRCVESSVNLLSVLFGYVGSLELRTFPFTHISVQIVICLDDAKVTVPQDSWLLREPDPRGLDTSQQWPGRSPTRQWPSIICRHPSFETGFVVCWEVIEVHRASPLTGDVVLYDSEAMVFGELNS